VSLSRRCHLPGSVAGAPSSLAGAVAARGDGQPHEAVPQEWPQGSPARIRCRYQQLDLSVPIPVLAAIWVSAVSCPGRFGLLANIPSGPREALKGDRARDGRARSAGFVIGSTTMVDCWEMTSSSSLFEELNIRRATILLHSGRASGVRPGLVRQAWATHRVPSTPHVLSSTDLPHCSALSGLCADPRTRRRRAPTLAHRIAQLGTRSSRTGLTGLTQRTSRSRLLVWYYDTRSRADDRARSITRGDRRGSRIIRTTTYRQHRDLEANYVALLSSTLISSKQLAATTETALRLFSGNK